MTDTAEKTEIQPVKANRIVVHDESEFASFLDTGRFEQLWRAAQLLAQSQVIPEHYRGNIPDCFIGLELAIRLGVNPLTYLQKSYVVHGKPGLEATFLIGLVNTSGLFKGSIQYDLSGEGMDRGCIAFAISKETGERINGPRVTMAIAKAEGWLGKNGSKWQTIPDLMLMYRSAAWFSRLHCPQRIMGMNTVDELVDAGETPPIAAVTNGNSTRGVAALAKKLKDKTPQAEPTEAKVIDNANAANAGASEPPIDPKPAETPEGTPSSPPGVDDGNVPFDQQSEPSPEEKESILLDECKQAGHQSVLNWLTGGNEDLKKKAGALLVQKGKIGKSHEVANADLLRWKKEFATK